MSSIIVAHVYKSLDFGGTAKRLEALMKYQRPPFNFKLFLFDELGARGERLRSAGMDIVTIDKPRDLLSFAKFSQADILHIHGSFELGTETIGIGENNDIPVIIKTTHFGMESDGIYSQYVDKYIHIAKMTLLRELRLKKISLETAAWADKYSVIYNPIDFDDVKLNGGQGLREELSIPEDTIIIGKIGRNAPEKWDHITIGAFEKLLQSRDVHLLLVNAPDKIREDIEARELADNVSYVNEIPIGKTSRFYNTIDILAHSSLTGECGPYVVLEAMAHKVPVVVNSTPMRDNGQIEMIKHNQRGLVANSTKSYSEAINSLIENEKVRDDFGEYGRKYVENNHNITDIIKRLETLYINKLMSKDVIDVHQDKIESESFKHYDMEKFEKMYTDRLKKSYGSSGVLYPIERYLWQFTSQYTPMYKEQLYKKNRGLITNLRSHLYK